MRYSRTDLLQLPEYHLDINDDIKFEPDTYKKFPRVRKLRNVRVVADGNYEPDEQRLYIHLHVKGYITCPCDITFEDVEFPFETEADEIFTFDKNETDINIIKSEGEYIELLPTVFRMILMEIPIKVVKSGKIDYPKGDGWEVISEADYEREKANKPDPRLAILKNYKPQDE